MVARAQIFEQIIEPRKGAFSPEHARYVLSLSFSDKLKGRYRRLSDKAQLGTLTADEQVELDDYLSANAILVAMKSKARVSLSRPSSAKRRYGAKD